MNLKMRAYKLQVKICLVHEISDLLVSGTSDVELKTYAKRMRKRLHDELCFMLTEAKSIVDECMKEARKYTEIHQQVNPEGVGRQTDFIKVLAELMNA